METTTYESRLKELGIGRGQLSGGFRQDEIGTYNARHGLHNQSKARVRSAKPENFFRRANAPLYESFKARGTNVKMLSEQSGLSVADVRQALSCQLAPPKGHREKLAGFLTPEELKILNWKAPNPLPIAPELRGESSRPVQSASHERAPTAPSKTHSLRFGTAMRRLQSR